MGRRSRCDAPCKPRRPWRQLPVPPHSRAALPAQIKFLDVDKEGNRLVASHKKAIVDSTIVDLTIGSVVKGALPRR